MRRYNWMIFIGVNLIMAVLVGYGYSRIAEAVLTSATITASPMATATSKPTPTMTPKTYGTPSVKTKHWVSWAVFDGKVIVGSKNWAQTNYLMSMIKPWIAADYLNHHQRPTSATLSRLASMILDSSNGPASEFFGGQPSWDRLVKTCGLTDLKARDWSWSTTGMSARDAARYGFCIYSGKATTPEWTAWIVDKMRHVRGQGDFGPRALFKDRTEVATKNGWENWQGYWYINCLAVKGDWSIAILQRWPYSGESYEEAIRQAEPVCNSIASQVLRLS